MEPLVKKGPTTKTQPSLSLATRLRGKNAKFLPADGGPMTPREKSILSDLPLRNLTQVDGRVRAVANFRRLRKDLLSDTGGDVPTTRLCVIDILAQCVAISREEFSALAVDPTRDPARFIGLGNLAVGAARTLGMKRIPKDLPSLEAYLAATQEPEPQQDVPSPPTPAIDEGNAP